MGVGVDVLEPGLKQDQADSGADPEVTALQSEGAGQGVMESQLGCGGSQTQYRASGS